MIGFCKDSPDGIHREVIGFVGGAPLGVCRNCGEKKGYEPITPKIYNTFQHGAGTGNNTFYQVLPFHKSPREVYLKYRR